MGSRDEGQSTAARSGRWLKDIFGRLNFYAMLRDRSRIRHICVELFDLYIQAKSHAPSASKPELYERVIAKHCSADQTTARRIMDRAEESFAAWPIERPLNLRDIVQYVAVTDDLKKDIAVSGVRSNVVDFAFEIVTEMIPAEA